MKDAISQAKPSSFKCKPAIRSDNGSHCCTLEIERTNWIRIRQLGTTKYVKPYNGKVTTAYCLDGDEHLFWGLPGEIRIYEMRTRQREEVGTFWFPEIIPSAMSYSNGLLVVGTNQGDLYFLSFWHNPVHFILSLENEGRNLTKKRKKA